MPYIKGKATSLQDLLDKTVAWATDTEIHGDDAWELVRNDPWPRGTIFKAKGVNGINSCYIGIMLVTHVKGESYRNWLLQTKNLLRHFVTIPSLFLDTSAIIHTNGADNFDVLKDKLDATKGRNNYKLYDIDIVNTSGTSLAFGVFKQYNDGLDWHEQPGCIEFGDLGQYPMYYSITGGHTNVAPPLYPGVGYPGFGMPSGEPLSGYFDYWLTKDASRITIVIKNREQWDMGHAGMLIPFHANMQYAFPAIAAGSCTGLRTVGSSDVSGVTKGSKIDYSYNSNDMSRSMPCAPCINTGTKTPEHSQLSLCLPDGKWNFFSNWTQEFKTNSSSGTYFTYERPVRTVTGNMLKPTRKDLTQVSTILGDDTTITIEPLELFQENTSQGSTNMLGRIWNMYWPGDPYNRYGEVEINNQPYLLLPNCWEERAWHLPSFNKFETPENLLATSKEIIKYGKQFKMLIRLEE
ncbi:hypothetical protein [Pelosinus fermentans]|uniref:Uncharacterized protein n=1 Tax=Pelosinus fermentans JBW45 TaxID=1192197 RepID=I9NMQ8_9FIRM|nr:hypothetical protein [Pelosinus fermentans]AJQ26925.1 hypothetical protein JBW_01575 [Pelosinus fermentans JBW45]